VGWRRVFYRGEVGSQAASHTQTPKSNPRGSPSKTGTAQHTTERSAAQCHDAAPPGLSRWNTTRPAYGLDPTFGDGAEAEPQRPPRTHPSRSTRSHDQ